MEDDEPLTRHERFERANYILAEIGCGRYDSSRKDGIIIEDLLLVIERMDARIRELESRLSR